MDWSPPGSYVRGILVCGGPVVAARGLDYWSGLTFPPPGDLPNPGIKPTSPALAGGFFTTEALG